MTATTAIPPGRRAGLAYLVLAALFTLGTVLPFRVHDPFAGTEIQPIADGAGFALVRPGLVTSQESAPAVARTPYRLGRFTVELALRPGELEERTRSIVGDVCELDDANWTVEQRGRALIVSRRDRFAELRDALERDRLSHLVLRFDDDRLVVHRDGHRIANWPWPSPGEEWEHWCRLTIGNTPTGEMPWRGEIHLLRLYDRPLADDEARALHDAWTASEPPAVAPDLELMVAATGAIGMTRGQRVVESLEPLDWIWSIKWERLRRSTWRERFESWYDLLGNLLITIPIGLAQALWLRRRGWSAVGAVIVATLSQLMLSTAVEVVQFFSSHRFASPNDIAANTVGALAGGCFAGAVTGGGRRDLPPSSS